MRKNFLLVCICALLLNCGSNFNSFYNAHKTDIGATSFQVPNFMKAVLSTVTSEHITLFKNIADFKYIKFENLDSLKRQDIIDEMNAVTQNGYTDMFRKNLEDNTRIISVIEVGDVVTDAIIFNSNNKTTSAYYLKGNFDPAKIKSFSNPDTFNNFTQELQQINPSFQNPTFNPNN